MRTVYAVPKLLCLFLIITFLNAPLPLMAAEVIFLGNGTSDDGAPKVYPSFSMDKRLDDLMDFGSYGQYGEDRSGMITGRIAVQGEYTSVRGNQSKSFYRDDNKDHLLELDLKVYEKLFSDYQFQGEANLRKTDNQRMESRNAVVLKQLNLSVSNDYNLFEFGDFYSDFSRFVMGASLEGANVELTPAPWISTKTVAARTYESGDGLYQRNVYGAKADLMPLADSPSVSLCRVGVQVVSVDDDTGSLKSDPSATDQDNNVAGLDGELRLRNGASLVFEAARSGYIADEDVSDRRLHGTAWRIMPGYRYKDVLNLRYLAYRVDPEFRTLVGSASSDKQQHQLSADWRISPAHTLTLTQNWYWDDLPNSDKAYRTRYNEQYLSLMSRPLEDRKNFSLRTYLNHQRKDSNDEANTADAKTVTLGASINDRIWEANVSAFGEYRHFTARPQSVDNEDAWRYGLNFSRDFDVFARRLYLSAGYTGNVRDNHATEGQDMQHGLTFNGRYEVAEPLTMSFGYNLQDAANTGATQDYQINTRFMEFAYRLAEQRNTVLSLRGEHNDYEYDTAGDDYSEARYSLKFVSNF
ncbi:hypothetical protein [Desulfovibrio ferrophilus]|uniref:Uncharacterized protein n=1 Tax=Desulfovibrio ferrophilus TaxID=241368 RepID=A0A2Z6B264_9BACT|nr:hypothetical protein [Desulfovibrio ferrophilus]BBD09520.1 uncharacterized protein DFE_2794 [Desulfovibrio ferrophilus]